MKVSNTDIIDTVTDEKKLNWCLIQGWCFKKSLSTVPKSEKYAIELWLSRRLNGVDVSQRNTVCFELTSQDFFSKNCSQYMTFQFFIHQGTIFSYKYK